MSMYIKIVTPECVLNCVRLGQCALAQGLSVVAACGKAGSGCVGLSDSNLSDERDARVAHAVAQPHPPARLRHLVPAPERRCMPDVPAAACTSMR